MCGVLGAFGTSVLGQQTQFPVFQDPPAIATLNRDRLLTGSVYGQKILERINAAGLALQAENAALQSDLEREELALTELRKTLPSEEFKPLAAVFDAKANRIRAEQRSKQEALSEQLEAARFSFFRRLEAVILDVMGARGVSFLLDEKAVLLRSVDSDITEDVIAALDLMFAQGDLKLNEN